MGPQLSRLGVRVTAVAAVAVLTGLAGCPPIALALDPPSVDPSLVPADGTPGPDEPLRRSNSCSVPVTLPDPDPGRLAPGFELLGITEAWQYSTGNGVPVAVIDTGVTPGPRLPVIAGGDYLTGGADGPPGLQDCDAHGTIAASLIAAAPQGPVPMPRPMPEVPAFPPPAGAAEPPADAPAEDGPGAPDGVVGVAPHARIISIRQSSRAFQPAGFGDDGQVKAGTLASLAKAVVHAADLGAKVINISVTSCTPAGAAVDQQSLGAALWYAATVRDAVIVTAAGNVGEAGCADNPMFDPLDPDDPRDWHQVRVVSSPSWFSDYVLSVGGVDATGAPLDKSMTGPWVGVAAPATDILGLSPQGGGPVNAYPPPRAGEPAIPFWGTSFSAAYVSGVAALVRAKYPDLSAHQVIDRIVQTAHHPPAGVDNRVGYGLVDPVAALTFAVRPGDRLAPGTESRVLVPAPPPPPPDHRARTVALAFLGVVALTGLATAVTARIRRAAR